MKVITFKNENWPKIDEEVVLCLGFFDGVHIGHRKLLNEAKDTGKKCAVLTFDKSPLEALGKSVEYLTSPDDKKKIVKGLGFDYYLEIEIDKEFLNTSKEDFINNIVNYIHPIEVFCGEDYTFGKNKEGNVSYLSSKIPTKIVDYQLINNSKVSSREIRSLIKEGNMDLVRTELIKEYRVKGTVVKGLQNGRKIKYPTANLALDFNYVLPKEGVYFGYTEINGKEYKSIASFGTHPTIDELDKPILEIHILHFHKDIYNEKITFLFSKFIRENKRFNSTNELVKQLALDKKKALSYKSRLVEIALSVAFLILLGISLTLLILL